MKIRKINKDERLQILKGDLYAYSRWTNQDLPRSHLTAINPEEVLAAEIDGKIVAALQCFHFQQSLRGVLKPMGGLGGIWTYPEYRNRGCVSALIKSAFLEMRMQGICVSMLAPFKESFYEALGYTIANSTTEITICISSLSHYLQQPNLSNGLSNWSCDRIPATEAKDILANFLYASLRSQTLEPHSHGIAITNFSYDQWWHLHRHKLCVVIKRDRQPVALAIYAIDSSANQQQQIEISAIFWTDIQSRDRLLYFFASHRDQIQNLKMPVPLGTNVHPWLNNAGQIAASMTAPWMVRAIDVVEAFRDLPMDCPPFSFALRDSHCTWNEGVFAVNVNQGKLAVKRLGNNGDRDLEIDFCATIAGISALLYGTSAIDELLQKQWITNINPETQKLVTKWFPQCVIYNPFKF